MLRKFGLDELKRDNRLQQELASILDNGGIGVYPTETIYGIGGRGDSETVRQKILAAKNRPAENPMILIAADLAAFSGFDLVFPAAADDLIQRFWPGNLTLVLPVKGGTSTAVRVSDHPFIQTMGPLLTYPLFSTSANTSGQPYNGEPDTLFRLFSDSVDFFIDAGVLPVSLPSTVVSVTVDGSVKVLREGAVPAAQITR